MRVLVGKRASRNESTRSIKHRHEPDSVHGPLKANRLHTRRFARPARPVLFSAQNRRLSRKTRATEWERCPHLQLNSFFQGSHDIGIAHDKALFFAGGRLVYRIVLTLKIVDVLWETRRGLVPGELQFPGQHRAHEIIRRAHRTWKIKLGNKLSSEDPTP